MFKRFSLTIKWCSSEGVPSSSFPALLMWIYKMWVHTHVNKALSQGLVYTQILNETIAFLLQFGCLPAWKLCLFSPEPRFVKSRSQWSEKRHAASVWNHVCTQQKAAEFFCECSFCVFVVLQQLNGKNKTILCLFSFLTDTIIKWISYKKCFVSSVP